MKRKLFIFLGLALILFSTSAQPILATSQVYPTVAVGKWYSPNIGEFQLKVIGSPDQEIFGERYTFAQVVWIIHSFTLLMQGDILNEEVRNALKQIFSSIQSGQNIAFSDYSKLGIPGVLMGGITEIYQNPVGSGIQYFAQGLQKFNIATPAYAQGYGYNNNTIVQPIWTASRNICYFLMVILLIAAGFMIMFRVKVNAQTAVSIQVMIPKIIITLILITFSYAIAGLLVDLTYLVLTLALSMLKAAGVVSDLGNAVQFFTGGFYKIFFFYLWQWLLLMIGPFISSIWVGPWAVLIPLIISIVLIWLLFKVWWMMMQTYISVLIGFIIAPWQILLGLIPGGGGGFGPWLRNMVANLAVFVVVPLMFLLASYLATSPLEWIANAGGEGSLPAIVVQGIQEFLNLDANGVAARPSTGKAISLPLFGLGSNIGFLMGFMASLGILTLIPKTAEAVKAALKVPPFKYGAAFGEALAPARWAAREGQAGGIEKAKLLAEQNPLDTSAQAAYRGAQTRQSLIDRGLGGKG